MPTAHIFLAAGIGAMIRGDQRDAGVGAVLGHFEAPGLDATAYLVGALLGIVVEIMPHIFGPLDHDGHEHVLVGKRLRIRNRGECQRAVEPVITVGATGYLRIGRIGDAEQLELQPEVILVAQRLVADRPVVERYGGGVRAFERALCDLAAVEGGVDVHV